MDQTPWLDRPGAGPKRRARLEYPCSDRPLSGRTGCRAVGFLFEADVRAHLVERRTAVAARQDSSSTPRARVVGFRACRSTSSFPTSWCARWSGSRGTSKAGSGWPTWPGRRDSRPTISTAASAPPSARRRPCSSSGYVSSGLPCCCWPERRASRTCRSRPDSTVPKPSPAGSARASASARPITASTSSRCGASWASPPAAIPADPAARSACARFRRSRCASRAGSARTTASSSTVPRSRGRVDGKTRSSSA